MATPLLKQNVQKAEMLTSFFATCFNKSQSPVESTDFYIPTSPDTFPSERLCNEEISDLLSSLDVSKSNGPDGIAISKNAKIHCIQYRSCSYHAFQFVAKTRQIISLLEKILCCSHSQKNQQLCLLITTDLSPC